MKEGSRSGKREIRRLAIAFGLLSDALDWLKTHKPAGRAATGTHRARLIDSLPDGYSEAFTTYLTDKAQLRAIKRATTTKGLRDLLAGWIDILHGHVCEEANRFNRKRQGEKNE